MANGKTSSAATTSSLRPFDLARDYEAVLALWRHAGPGVSLSASDSREALALKLTRDPDLFLVAEDAGQIIGTIIGAFDGRRGMVYHLAVAPEHRHRGVGTQLLTAVEKRLRERGCRRCYLMVLPENTSAQEFYRRQGWEIMPVYLMGKEL